MPRQFEDELMGMEEGAPMGPLPEEPLTEEPMLEETPDLVDEPLETDENREIEQVVSSALIEMEGTSLTDKIEAIKDALDDIVVTEPELGGLQEEPLALDEEWADEDFDETEEFDIEEEEE